MGVLSGGPWYVVLALLPTALLCNLVSKPCNKFSDSEGVQGVNPCILCKLYNELSYSEGVQGLR